jgi:hypothetical protein
MVRAILAGRKTQTRRLVKPQPDIGWDRDVSVVNGQWVSEGMVRAVHCRYGVPEDLLFVRETHWRWTGCGDAPENWIRSPDGDRYQSRGYANDPQLKSILDGACAVTVPSIHMPRWASRITLQVTAVRVERVQDITAADAIAEGCMLPEDSGTEFGGRVRAVTAFRDLWDKINGPRGHGWDANPWVWVVEFARINQEA